MIIATQKNLADAQRALAESTFHDIRSLEVEQVDGRLILHGNVSSYYHKQQAQEAIRTVARDLDLVVENQVAVAKPR